MVKNSTIRGLIGKVKELTRHIEQSEKETKFLRGENKALKDENVILRAAKVKQKISNSFRIFKEAEIYSRIEGFISTARKNKRCVFTELFNTFKGHNFITG